MIGIYKITNLINNKIYIGQSVDIMRRFGDHKRFAINKNSKEYNTPLHRAIRKYGIENFNIENIEECNCEELDDKEKFWISYYDASNTLKGYNLTKGGLGGHKKNCKHVLQYDLEGNFIKEWNATWEAAEALNITNNNIRSACYKNGKSAGGYQWKFKDDNTEIKKYQRDTSYKGLELGRIKQPIFAISKDNKEEYFFNSIKEGVEWLISNNKTKSSCSSLQSRISTIKNTNHICCGFYWVTKKGDDNYS